jgi:hypothetical protein
MRHLIETSVARMGATIHHFGANLDYEVLSLPGGSIIALLMWLYGSAKDSIAHPFSPSKAQVSAIASLPAPAEESAVERRPPCLRSALCCAGKI